MNDSSLLDIFSQPIISYVASAIAVFVLFDAAIRLWTERHRLTKDELNSDDLNFASRLALFLALPLSVLLDLRVTEIVASYLGTQITDVTYGFIWYNANLKNLFLSLKDPYLLLTLFAGSLSQIMLALSLLPTLSFRPHPFFSAVVGYFVIFLLGLNLLVDPLLSLAGSGPPRFEYLSYLLFQNKHSSFAFILAAGYCLMLTAYLSVLCSSRCRLWFSSLVKPLVTEQLKEHLALRNGEKNPSNLALLHCGILYLRAGLSKKVRAILKEMEKESTLSLEINLLEGLFTYQRHNFKKARKHFELASQAPWLEAEKEDLELKAKLLAAAACSAFAQNDVQASLNLADRALEFDNNCIVARMVKVDAYLKKQDKDACQQEILIAMHIGLEFDLKDKVPISTDEALSLLETINSRKDKISQYSIREL